jgi:hypothetical protein
MPQEAALLAKKTTRFCELIFPFLPIRFLCKAHTLLSYFEHNLPLASPMTKATELAMLKLRIKFDIGILRWFSNLAKNSSLNPLLFQKTNQSPLKINL